MTVPARSARDKIIGAAMDLFWSKGYNSTSIADILSRTQLNSGSLYHAFPGKQDILIAVLEAYRDGIYPMLIEPAWGQTEDPIERIFALDPRARVIWAHTGMNTPEARIDELFARYPNLFGELSFRGGITVGGEISPEWRALFAKYPDRFVLGTDTWVPQRWPEVPDIIAGYRRWLAQLPPEIAEQVAWRNGARLFFGE